MERNSDKVVNLSYNNEMIDEKEKQFNEIKSQAENGDAQAQYDLAKLLYFGEHYNRDGFYIKGDMDEAVNWFKKSAMQGNVFSMDELAFHYINHYDDTNANIWYSLVYKFSGNAYGDLSIFLDKSSLEKMENLYKKIKNNIS